MGRFPMTEAVVRPIIIKKKIVKADGHHGGAWKVAYADFVTAMMAFFLLMWLLNATTEEQRKGIADYFNPNIPLAAVSGGGSDALSGDSLFTEDTLAKSGTGAVANDGKDTNGDKKSYNEEQVAALNASIKSDNEALSEHISLKMSPEGLVIELVDSAEKPLFSIGDASPSPILNELLSVVASSFGSVKNNIKIAGHTDSLAFSNKTGYSNWELSTDRANTARRVLIDYGFPHSQITEVSGKANTDPVSDDPSAPQNRRISITLL